MLCNVGEGRMKTALIVDLTALLVSVTARLFGTPQRLCTILYKGR